MFDRDGRRPPSETGETAKDSCAARATAADLSDRCCSTSGGGLPDTYPSASCRRRRDPFVDSVAVGDEHDSQRRYSGGAPNPHHTSRSHKAFSPRPRTDNRKVHTLAQRDLHRSFMAHSCLPKHIVVCLRRESIRLATRRRSTTVGEPLRITLIETTISVGHGTENM